MKINFAEIKFRPSLFDEPVEIKDFHKQLANAIWQNKEVAAGKFALELFDNPDVEIDDIKKGYIKAAMDNFLQWVTAPVLEALEKDE